MTKKACMLYSGGTDSTAACVSIIEEGFHEIHLLTFYEKFTGKPSNYKNIDKIKNKYPQVSIHHEIICIDNVLKKLMYAKYLKSIWKFGFFVLCSPLQSALSWHLLANKYCNENEIEFLFDGVTDELKHLPNHTEVFLNIISNWHSKNNVIYKNPVKGWEVYTEQSFLDRLIVGQHGFFLNENDQNIDSTGNYLYKKGVFDHPNLKGSTFDKNMQQECYPFLLFNIYLFWYFYAFNSENDYKKLVSDFLEDRINFAEEKILV